MRRPTAFRWILGGALVAGCTKDLPPPPKDWLKQDLGGVVDGKPWKYRYAYIDPTARTAEEDDWAFVFLPFKPKKPCPKELAETKSLRTVTVAAPKATKALMLERGTTRVLVFQYNKNGDPWTTVAKKGKIKLTKISDTEVSGKILGTFNSSNWVSGNFKATVCDYADMKHGDDDDD